MAFHIALNMAGAVSAGAYTAGVLDFLVEAIDEWYEERENQRRLHGDDVQSWTIPAHEVILDVMTGASAGGMCAAIASVALREAFDHVRQTNPPAGVPVNRLYQSWVRTIDILKLLGTQDLPDNEGPVRSILDSTPIDRIAETALRPDRARLRRRRWVAPEMTAILTLSNLRGIPYSVAQAAGSYEERIAYHADQIQFTIAEQGAADTPTTVAVNYSDPPDSHGWKMLQSAAMATGAFPVMLASRALVRRKADYENRRWHIANAESDGAGQCESITKIDPSWGVPDVPATFGNVYADGGVTNNNPFECARRFLTVAAGNENGRNPREPENANAAVISIAPFPGDEPFDLNYDTRGQSELINVLKALLGALVSQSRFQGEELKLTQDENVSSRFAIAPSDDTSPTQPALLCGVFSAFGGFIEEKFRDRDYQLGRRNCQQFLRTHFVLPEDNVAIAAGLAKKAEILDSFRREYGQQIDGRWWYSIVPLMPQLRTEIAVPPREGFKTTEARLDQVADAATNRLKSVLHAFLRQPGQEHGGWSFLIGAVFDLGGASKIKDFILDKLRSELRSSGQL